eukprot:3898902-Pleurochrysis_carterae.AAC.1
MAGTGRERASRRKGSNASLRSSPRSVVLDSRATRPERRIALSGWLGCDQGAESFATQGKSECGLGSESERPRWHGKQHTYVAGRPRGLALDQESVEDAALYFQISHILACLVPVVDLLFVTERMSESLVTKLAGRWDGKLGMAPE